jgi:hypothetical protein
MAVQNQPGQVVCKTLSQKKKKKERKKSHHKKWLVEWLKE